MGVCSIFGCDSPTIARGWCTKHYKRWQMHGDANRYVPRTIEERFWPKVQKDPSGCWNWTGTSHPRGYGAFLISRHKRVYAHRLAYELKVGKIPAGLTIDHLCRNTRCVNPAHLEPVTSAVNVLRGISPQAINARKTACCHGHDFTHENTLILQNGSRRCRTCNRLNMRRIKALKKLERA